MRKRQFKDWLQSEMEKRGWSQRELAAMTKEKRRRDSDPIVSQTAIHFVLSGERPATWNFCAGIAPAFDMSPIEVFVIAGLISQSDVDYIKKNAEIKNKNGDNDISYTVDMINFTFSY